MSRGSRATLYFFFAVVSLLIGAIAVYAAGPIVAVGHAAEAPWLEIYGWVVLLVALAAPILFVVTAFYALLFGRDE